MLPQLTQVPSRKYQTSSCSSKDAIIEKTCEPQGQTCTGPRPRRSVPNLSGSLALNFGSLGRRNRTVSTIPSCPSGAPFGFIRLTAHIVVTSSVANATTRRSLI
jgi:hypothetical protein